PSRRAVRGAKLFLRRRHHRCQSHHCISSYSFFSFFLLCYAALPPLHSFPTRRSSDLGRALHQIHLAIVESALLPQLDHAAPGPRSEEHTSELQSRFDLVCRLLLEKKKDDEQYPLDCDCRCNDYRGAKCSLPVLNRCTG